MINMHYSLISIVGLVLLILTNYDAFIPKLRKKDTNFTDAYKGFLYAMFVFYIADAFWGLFWYLSLRTALNIASIFYFITMSLTVPFFVKYTVEYVGEKRIIKNVFLIIASIFFIFSFCVCIINIFTPIMFSIDNEANFISLKFRYIILGIHFILILLVAIYAFVESVLTKGINGRKYLAIAIFGFIVVIAIIIQMAIPSVSFFTIGSMVGTCMLRTFVIDTEKEEYRLILENSLQRERNQSNELKEAWNLAYTDALTGVGSKLSYLEVEDYFDKLINEKNLDHLALAVFDINDLKVVNDTLGHQAGDKYIIDACTLIKDTFKNSKVFRIGGDEFIVILEDADYAIKESLADSFRKHIEANMMSNNVVVSMGIAEYINDLDYSFGRIVNRADFMMYEEKKRLKEKK